ncbi:MAG: hypothetical protein K6E92_01720 [Lachnospiraceae bacterium]|nr:hypothetical protein [Lachnospiraceae bacterium]
MEQELQTAGMDLVNRLAHLNYGSGLPFVLIMLAISAAVCFSGYRFYRAALSVAAFFIGYYLMGLVGSRLGWDAQTLLIAEVVAGLLLGVVAYRIMLAAVFIAVFGFARMYLPSVLDSLGVSYGHIAILVGALVIALLAKKLTRAVLVIVTAVLGGFTMVTVFRELLMYLPPEAAFHVPAAGSMIWLVAKILVSAAGTIVQDPKA